jgi:hypothetical protein
LVQPKPSSPLKVQVRRSAAESLTQDPLPHVSPSVIVITLFFLSLSSRRLLHPKPGVIPPPPVRHRKALPYLPQGVSASAWSWHGDVPRFLPALTAGRAPMFLKTCDDSREMQASVAMQPVSECSHRRPQQPLPAAPRGLPHANSRLLPPTTVDQRWRWIGCLFISMPGPCEDPAPRVSTSPDAASAA